MTNRLPEGNDGVSEFDELAVPASGIEKLIQAGWIRLVGNVYVMTPKGRVALRNQKAKNYDPVSFPITSVRARSKSPAKKKGKLST